MKVWQLGAVKYLSAGEARLATSTPPAVQRAWDLWVAQVEGDLES